MNFLSVIKNMSLLAVPMIPISLVLIKGGDLDARDSIEYPIEIPY